MEFWAEPYSQLLLLQGWRGSGLLAWHVGRRTATPTGALQPHVSTRCRTGQLLASQYCVFSRWGEEEPKNESAVAKFQYCVFSSVVHLSHSQGRWNFSAQYITPHTIHTGTTADSPHLSRMYSGTVHPKTIQGSIVLHTTYIG